MKLNEVLQQEILRQNEALKSGDRVKGPGFKEVLQGAIEEVNQLQLNSDEQIKNLLTGKSQDINATVLAVQEADTSFRLMMQVRNKIVEAYKEISRTGM